MSLSEYVGDFFALPQVLHLVSTSPAFVMCPELIDWHSEHESTLLGDSIQEASQLKSYHGAILEFTCFLVHIVVRHLWNVFPTAVACKSP